MKLTKEIKEKTNNWKSEFTMKILSTEFHSPRLDWTEFNRRWAIRRFLYGVLLPAIFYSLAITSLLFTFRILLK